MKIVETTVSRFSLSTQNPKNCVIKGHGTMIIVPNSTYVLSKPPNSKVVIEILHNQNNVRIGCVKKIEKEKIKKTVPGK